MPVDRAIAADERATRAEVAATYARARAHVADARVCYMHADRAALPGADFWRNQAACSLAMAAHARAWARKQRATLDKPHPYDALARVERAAATRAA